MSAWLITTLHSRPNLHQTATTHSTVEVVDISRKTHRLGAVVVAQAEADA